MHSFYLRAVNQYARRTPDIVLDVTKRHPYIYIQGLYE